MWLLVGQGACSVTGCTAHSVNRYRLPSSGCNLAPLEIGAVYQAGLPHSAAGASQCESSVLLMGDSHIRNVFGALTNGLRGQRYFAETHERKKTSDFLLYEVGYDQRLNLMWDRASNGMFDKSELPKTCCAYKSSLPMEFCLRVLYIWAPKFESQHRNVAKLRVLGWDPGLVVVAPGNTYEPHDAWPLAYQQVWERHYNSSGLSHLAVLHWPNDRSFLGDVYDEREAALAKWDASAPWVSSWPLNKWSIGNLVKKTIIKYSTIMLSFDSNYANVACAY